MGMHTHVYIFTLLLTIFNHSSVLLYEPWILLQLAKSSLSSRRYAFVRTWALTATEIAVNQCFYFFNPYASQLAWYKSHCGQFTLKWNIHFPADFIAGFLGWCIKKTLLFKKNDYNFVTNLSRLYFSAVGWCLFWLTSHYIIYTLFMPACGKTHNSEKNHRCLS